VPAKGSAGAKGRRLKVTQIRSGIGHPAVHRRTLRSIGLKHHQDVVVVPDTPSVRGMLKRVRHLVAVTPVEEG
jgi:large subunit ribosomal protein L30